MKTKIFLLATLSLLSFTARAQEPIHLEFMGLSMGLPLESFSDSLVAKGFNYSNSKNNIAIFDGCSFAAYDSCIVQLQTKEDVIYSISVRLPECHNWADLEKDYTAMKEFLQEMFGRPESTEERFVNTPSGVDLQFDVDKFDEVLHGRCKYTTLYLTEAGRIFVTIMHYKLDGESHAGVYVNFIDYENLKKS